MILLEYESNLLVSQRGTLLRFQMMHRGFAQEIFAAPAVIVHAQDVQERRFTRAGRSHDGDKIAFPDFQIDVAQDVKKLLLR